MFDFIFDYSVACDDHDVFRSIQRKSGCVGLRVIDFKERGNGRTWEN